MGDCLKEMIWEIEDTQDHVKHFSAVAERLDDDEVLWAAEELVEEIRAMIETKKAVNEELGYRKY